MWCGGIIIELNLVNRREAFVFYAFPNKEAAPEGMKVAPLCFKSSYSKPEHVEISMQESCDHPGLWKQLFVLFATPVGTPLYLLMSLT